MSKTLSAPSLADSLSGQYDPSRHDAQPIPQYGKKTPGPFYLNPLPLRTFHF
jgi:hypothetical protein